MSNLTEEEYELVITRCQDHGWHIEAFYQNHPIYTFPFTVVCYKSFDQAVGVRNTIIDLLFEDHMTIEDYLDHYRQEDEKKTREELESEWWF